MSLITERLSSQIFSLFRHIKFDLLLKYLFPTFYVRYEPLLYFLSLNTTSCLIEFNIHYEATEAAKDKYKWLELNTWKITRKLKSGAGMHNNTLFKFNRVNV